MVNKVWDNEKIKKLRQLVMEGNRGGQIAKIISSLFNVTISRNAIIGAVNRHMDPEARAKFRLGQPRRGVKSNDLVNKKDVMVKIYKPSIEIEEAKPSLDGVSLEALERHQCRWPITAKSPHRFCGKKRLEGKPYCAEHAAIAFTGWK